MGSSWWRRRLVVLILCVLQPMLPVSHGCFPEERAALMEIHASLVRANSTTLFAPPWGKRLSGHDDCCLWKRVRCNNATRRVSHIDLKNVYYDIDPGASPAWSLDTTVFAAFPMLQFLDLSWNIPILLSFDGFKNLSNLRELHLSSNNISGNLPSFIFSLPHIEVLDLSRNMFEGPIPINSSSSNIHTLLSFDGFKNLSNIRKLDLSFNGISGNLLSFLFSLPHIELLDLSGNMVEGPIPISSSSNLSLSLRSLRLPYNMLSGRFSFFWLNNLSNLVEIDLSGNANLGVNVNIPEWVPEFQLKRLLLSGCDIDKDIIAKPKFIGTQHRLEDLDLSNNNLSGVMPNWLFTKGLVNLDLGNNSLTGSLDPIWYPQTSLQSINISMNHIVGQLPANISSVFPCLTSIDVSDNNFSGEIPMSLCHINNIYTLDLSNNNFFGEMPSCLFTDLTNLETLRVSNNNLDGPILGGRNNLSVRVYVYLDGNKFQGALPRNLSGQLWVMDLHDNKLTGELDASSWNLSQLLLLDVAGNYMTGEIHPQVCALPSIEFLELSNNHFTGPIRSCNSMSLESLDMSVNWLSGDVSWEHFNTPSLFNLDISRNMLTGNLSWVHRFQWISVLSLGHNEFHGQIPSSLCELRYLRIIDLSHNKLSGPVPPCVGAISFKDTQPHSEGFIGTVPMQAQGGFTFGTKGMHLMYDPEDDLMSGIDLSGNLLSGEIPWELGELSHVKSLNLSHNALVGPIPTSLANMSEVESLDLSHNEHTGVIPPELTQLWSLEVFFVSYNRLSGCVPRSGQFGSFDTSSYDGNSQLKMECTSAPPGFEPSPIPPREEMVVDVGTYIVGAASFVLAFWATVAFSFCHSTGRRMVLKL